MPILSTVSFSYSYIYTVGGHRLSDYACILKTFRRLKIELTTNLVWFLFKTFSGHFDCQPLNTNTYSELQERT